MNSEITKDVERLKTAILNDEDVKQFLALKDAIKNDNELLSLNNEMRSVQKIMCKLSKDDKDYLDIHNKYELIKQQYESYPLISDYELFRKAVYSLLKEISGCLSE